MKAFDFAGHTKMPCGPQTARKFESPGLRTLMLQNFEC